MRKKLFLLIAVAIFTAVCINAWGDVVLSHCNHDPARDLYVCREGAAGLGSVCVVENCGPGWFKPDCDCYSTGWGD